MNITILLLSFNGADVIAGALASLLPLPENYHLLVLDNGSHDESVAIATTIAAQHDRVIVVEHGRNLGFSGGMNSGIRLATGQTPHAAIDTPADVVVLFNQDARALPGWHEAMIAPFARDARIAAVGCLLYDHTGAVEHLGGYLEGPQGSAYHRRPENGVIPETLLDVEYATGAVLALRTSILAEVGGFDERYNPAYCEEIDLCYRLHRAGYRVVVNPKAQAIHATGANDENLVPRLRMYNRGRLLLMIKTRPFETLMDEFAPAELAFINHGAGHPQFLANRQAYTDALMRFDDWMQAREELQPRLTLKERQQIYAMLLRFRQQSISQEYEVFQRQLDGLEPSEKRT